MAKNQKQEYNNASCLQCLHVLCKVLMLREQGPRNGVLLK